MWVLGLCCALSAILVHAAGAALAAPGDDGGGALDCLLLPVEDGYAARMILQARNLGPERAAVRLQLPREIDGGPRTEELSLDQAATTEWSAPAPHFGTAARVSASARTVLISAELRYDDSSDLEHTVPIPCSGTLPQLPSDAR